MAGLRATLDKILVDGWQRAWTWLSVHFSLALMAFPTLPQEWQAAIILAVVTPFGLTAAQLPILLGGLYLLIRLLRQHKAQQGQQPPQE